MLTWAEHTLEKSYVAKKLGTVPRLFGEGIEHVYEKINHKIRPTKDYKPPKDIDFAYLSQQAYKEGKDREVEGYTIDNELSSPDRVVYKHNATGHAVIAFRGTDLKNLKGGISSKAFRDVGADLLLAAGAESLSHRFYNAEEVTKKAVDKYGKEHLSVTGHSLGGSQALDVSRMYGVHAEVYNPHVTWENSLTRTNYYNATLHQNETDPVGIFNIKGPDVFTPVHYGIGGKFEGPTYGATDIRRHGYGIKAHGIDNFVHPSSLIHHDTIHTPGSNDANRSSAGDQTPRPDPYRKININTNPGYGPTKVQ